MPPATTAPSPASLPLDGVLVADFSRLLAGPLATMTLADLGARVIKVEHPERGDDTRGWAPPRSATGATYFESVNRNKESVGWDLKDPEDQRRAAALAARADVVVHNLKPGTMERLGLGYDDVARENPSVVYAAVSGFGDREGRDLPGYDFIVQAAGGLMSITGEPDAPMKAGVALVDVLTAKDLTAGVLAALLRRERTGEGAHLRLNLLSSLQGALANQGQAWLGAGVVPRRMGNDHPSIAPYQLLACRDALSAQTAAHWRDVLQAERLPAGLVSTVAEGVELAESLGLEPTVEVQDRSGAPAGRQFRHPVQWDPPVAHPRHAPPALGTDTAAVNTWLDAP